MVLSVLLSFLFHNAAKEQELAAVRDHAIIISDLLNSGVTGHIYFTDKIKPLGETARMTIIAPDGSVLLDSRASAVSMENHSDRPEIIDALRNEVGEASRYSDTLHTDMYYYAVKLDDGNILRISRAVGGLADVFSVTLPIAVAATVLIMILANFAAKSLTKRVVGPIEDINFNGNTFTVYEELLPYTQRIDRQRQELNEKLAELTQRTDTIEAITVNMREGLILTDNTGSVLIANKSARSIFGDHIEQINVLHICREEVFQNAVKKCLSGDNVEIRLERDGKVFNVYLSPAYSSGEEQGSVILFQDATERNRAEKQRREFSANVSHELKTPLTTISALSEMIESGMAKSDDVSSFAARISEQSGRLLALIEDIIRLSEFDEGSVKKEDTVFDIRELAEAVINSLADNAGGINIELTGESLLISANHRMIDELLYNLIDNGVKYNKDGGLVTVGFGRDEGGMCRISVSDTGIGIPEEHRERIFERFYRVDRSRSKKTGGTGLGLSIVKHITEYYGGSIELHSTEGVGTTVTCLLKI